MAAPGLPGCSLAAPLAAPWLLPGCFFAVPLLLPDLPGCCLTSLAGSWPFLDCSLVAGWLLPVVVVVLRVTVSSESPPTPTFPDTNMCQYVLVECHPLADNHGTKGTVSEN